MFLKYKKYLIAVMLIVGMFFLTAGNSLTVHAAGRTVAIDSCLISGTEVICQISASKVPASDDGFYYVYADEV